MISIIGASLIGLTWIVRNLVLEDRLPSVTLYSTTSIPFKSGLETNEPDKPATLNWPKEVPLKIRILNSSESLSISSTGKSKEADESSSNAIARSKPVGASLTGLTRMLKLCSTIKAPSLIIILTDTEPNQFVEGINVNSVPLSDSDPSPVKSWASYDKSSSSISLALIFKTIELSSTISWSEI